jgi:hypothetical protein
MSTKEYLYAPQSKTALQYAALMKNAAFYDVAQ